MCEVFDVFEVEVPVIFLGMAGFSPRRDRRYQTLQRPKRRLRVVACGASMRGQPTIPVGNSQSAEKTGAKSEDMARTVERRLLFEAWSSAWLDSATLTDPIVSLSLLRRQAAEEAGVGSLDGMARCLGEPPSASEMPSHSPAEPARPPAVNSLRPAT